MDAKKAEYIKLVVRRLYDAQKLRIQSDLRMQRLVRDGLVLKEDAERTFAKAFELEVATENEYQRIIHREVRDLPIMRDWLTKVRGIGPRLSGLFIANIQDPARFATVSKLWAYCGMHVIHSCPDESCDLHGEPQTTDRGDGPPACAKCSSRLVGSSPRRRKGQKANWSSELRTACWKAGESFVKTAGPYRELYDEYRERLICREVGRGNVIWRSKESKWVVEHAPPHNKKGAKWHGKEAPEWTVGRIHAMAKRRTVKLFLSHLLVVWREMEGLETPDPFPIGRLGHEHKIEPQTIIEWVPDTKNEKVA